MLAGSAREVERLVSAEPAVLRVAVAVVVQLPLRVAAQDVPRGVERRRMRPERAVDRLRPAIWNEVERSYVPMYTKVFKFWGTKH